jgi:hypothetical protein
MLNAIFQRTHLAICLSKCSGRSQEQNKIGAQAPKARYADVLIMPLISEACKREKVQRTRVCARGFR